MCEFGVLDVFDCTPTEPHGLTTLLYRRQPLWGHCVRLATLRLSPSPQRELLQWRRALPIYRNIFTLPNHSSVKFKRVQNYLSARITDNYRALGIMDEDTVIWFWIGNHSEYERLIKRKR